MSSMMRNHTRKEEDMLQNILNRRSPVFFFLLFSCCITLSAAFSPSRTVAITSTSRRASQDMNVSSSNRHRQRTQQRTASTLLQNSKADDDDADLENYDPNVAAQIRKARQLLRDAKKKMQTTTATEEESQKETEASSLPFFAQKSFTATAFENSQKIKSKTKSGEIIADGDTMTTLSNSEPWELRSLSQIGFQSEDRVDYDGNVVEVDLNGHVKGVNKALADKDVAMSIYNLRKTLQNEDFKMVFDSRNRFIGEVD